MASNSASCTSCLKELCCCEKVLRGTIAFRQGRLEADHLAAAVSNYSMECFELCLICDRYDILTYLESADFSSKRNLRCCTVVFYEELIPQELLLIVFEQDISLVPWLPHY